MSPKSSSVRAIRLAIGKQRLEADHHGGQFVTFGYERGTEIRDWRPDVGELVRIVPNHVCVVVHLNDVIYGIRGDVVETSWPVEARGRQRAAD